MERRSEHVAEAAARRAGRSDRVSDRRHPRSRRQRGLRARRRAARGRRVEDAHVIERHDDRAGDPPGVYTVRVDARSMCGDASAAWVVTVISHGERLAEAHGIATPTTSPMNRMARAPAITALRLTLCEGLVVALLVLLRGRARRRRCAARVVDKTSQAAGRRRDDHDRRRARGDRRRRRVHRRRCRAAATRSRSARSGSRP